MHSFARTWHAHARFEYTAGCICRPSRTAHGHGGGSARVQWTHVSFEKGALHVCTFPLPFPSSFLPPVWVNRRVPPALGARYCRRSCPFDIRMRVRSSCPNQEQE
ncbi:hypothetical protein COLSTE_01143 [Collinsella stercoris DSM 13279]|uniref:Uncharacterized protein n=1 Tax=Collinsella stercoris DSM 13279 TaxID=445975 RepID=B6GAP3_9ACTN|nr:hypothetical protein COLSTE_01143 [Collinsella stercoris DSM 13279]